MAGSIFLDAANAPDYSDFNSILYGHHMDKDTMFGELGLFSEETYTGTGVDAQPAGGFWASVSSWGWIVLAALLVPLLLFVWIEATNAIGIISKSGRYGGGIFAHRDIAFEFGTWLSAEFKFYLVKEFDRLKSAEQKNLSLEWNFQRTLSKINYRIHTDAIAEVCMRAGLPG